MVIKRFNTGYLAANFTEALLENGQEDSVVKNALVAVEGSFKDNSGTAHTFTTERLNTICEHTNRNLNNGGSLPVCTDHKKTIENTVGNVQGQAFTKVITEADLPNPKATHLLGKLGLFLNDVVIKTKDVAQKVRDNVVGSVSMGLNLDPNNHAIMELSLVPIPAIPSMGLFSFGVDESNAFTWDDLETTEQTIDDLKEEYTNLTDNLWKILNNIYTNESVAIEDVETLKQYVYAALNGFSTRVVDMFGLTEVGASPTDENGGAPTDVNETKYQDMQTGANPQAAAYSRADRTAKFARAARYVRASKVKGC
jgi:hypothetical protein